MIPSHVCLEKKVFKVSEWRIQSTGLSLKLIAFEALEL
jgi:hypothetical protein